MPQNPGLALLAATNAGDDLRVYKFTESTSGVNGVAADSENSEDESCGLPAT